MEDRLIEVASDKFAVRDYGGNGRDSAFHAVSFDMRGHGQTPVDSEWPQQYWRDIAALIRGLKLNRPVLVGHSTGGYAVTAHAASGGECSAIVVLDGFVLDNRQVPDDAHGWSIPEDRLWDMFRYGWKADRHEPDLPFSRYL